MDKRSELISELKSIRHTLSPSGFTTRVSREENIADFILSRERSLLKRIEVLMVSSIEQAEVPDPDVVEALSIIQRKLVE